MLVLIIFAVIAVSLAIKTHKLKYFSIKLILAIEGTWISALIFLTLMISSHTFYNEMFKKFFYTKSVPLWFFNQTIFSTEATISILYMSVFLFRVLTYIYTLDFTRPKNYKSIGAFILSFNLVFAVFSNPYFYKLFVNLLKPHLEEYKYINFIYDSLLAIGSNTSFLINFYMIYLLIKKAITAPQIEPLKNYIILNSTFISINIFIHSLIFRWIPKRLLKPTLFPDIYTFSAKIDLGSVFIHNTLLFFTYILAIFMIYILLKTNLCEVVLHHKKTDLENNLDISSGGVRVLFHSLKNNLLAIKYEVEGLEEDNLVNKKDVELIKESTSEALEYLNRGARTFEEITISKENIPVKVLLEKIISKLTDKQSNRVHIHPENQNNTISGDLLYLSDAIYNIIKNSFEAVYEDKLSISIKIETYGSVTVIIVSDNGPGIPDSIKDKIFLPFTSTKSSKNNWGVGLTFTYKVISAHKGKISLVNSKNSGTTFKILLPSC